MCVGILETPMLRFRSSFILAAQGKKARLFSLTSSRVNLTFIPIVEMG